MYAYAKMGFGIPNRGRVHGFDPKAQPFARLGFCHLTSNFQDYRWLSGKRVRFYGGLCGILYLGRHSGA